MIGALEQSAYVRACTGTKIVNIGMVFRVKDTPNLLFKVCKNKKLYLIRLPLRLYGACLEPMGSEAASFQG